jgi:hypothetical protein
MSQVLTPGLGTMSVTIQSLVLLGPGGSGETGFDVQFASREGLSSMLSFELERLPPDSLIICSSPMLLC